MNRFSLSLPDLAACLLLSLVRRAAHDDWGEPTNLGPTVNSLQEDNDPDLFSDGSNLMFTSNRPGGHGSWDTWQVPIEPVVDLNVASEAYHTQILQRTP